MTHENNRTPPAIPRVVDCHGHVKWYGYDADKLVANMDEHGIDVTWLLTWEAPADEAPSARVFWPGRVGMPLEDVVEAVSRHPARFVPCYAPDPRRADAMERLRGAVDFHGVRAFGELKVRLPMDDQRALKLFDFCGERGMPVTFHMDLPAFAGKARAHWYCGGWDNVAAALAKCPDTIFLGHAPGFWRFISGDAESCPRDYPDGPVAPGGRLWEFLDRYTNLYCDLSANSGLTAVSRDPKVGREFLLKYQDRCLFGRDFFDGRLMEFLRSLGLPKETMDKILGGNALRLVPLPDLGGPTC